MKYYYYKIKDKIVQNYFPPNSGDKPPGVLEFYVESTTPPTEEQINAAYIAAAETRSRKLNTEKLASLREKRDTLLTASDWTQAPDSPLPTELKEQWRIYRQELRDLPSSNKPCWPTPPPTK